MAPIDVDGIALDRCPACGGIWFDLGELRHVLGLKHTPDKSHLLKDDRANAHVDVHSRKPCNCPRDNVPMTIVHDPRQPHIAMDLCPHCGGIFLDSGELADLSKHTLRERLGVILGRLRSHG